MAACEAVSARKAPMEGKIIWVSFDAAPPCR